MLVTYFFVFAIEVIGFQILALRGLLLPYFWAGMGLSGVGRVRSHRGITVCPIPAVHEPSYLDVSC